MKIISFVSRKGGVGKSKLTQIACNYLHRSGDKPVVFDMDTQHSIYHLRQAELVGMKSKGEKKDIYPILPVQPQKFIESIKPFYQEGYNYVFLDLPGSFDVPYIKEIYTWLDYAFVPMGTSPEDLMSSQSFISLMEQEVRTGREKRNLKYSLHGVFNRIDPKMIRFKEVRENTSKLFNIPFLESYFTEQKSAFQDNASTIHPYRTSKGFKAVNDFCYEIEQIIRN